MAPLSEDREAYPVLSTDRPIERVGETSTGGTLFVGEVDYWVHTTCPSSGIWKGDPVY